MDRITFEWISRTHARLIMRLGLILSLALTGFAVPCRADEVAAEAADEVPDVAAGSSSYCGIYCVYAAVHGFGKEVDFRSLLKTRYIGTPYGSSIHELAFAAEDNGLHALPMMGLSRANLLSARSPIVLHVSQPSSPGYFGHWVLFLGMENGKAKILDAPHKPELIPIADILAQWDGVGLYISEEPLSPWRLKLESMLTGENLALLAALLVVTALLRRLLGTPQTNGGNRPIWVAVPGLLAATGLIAIAWHFLSDDGYARNSVAMRTVVQQHMPSFLPKLGIPEMEKALKDEKVVIVDARYPRDYQSGHLPGAINVPVFTTQAERRKLLANVPKDARLVVYCQSESCKFDESLGSALVAEGIENVSLFPGGWAQWEEKGKPPEAANKEEAP
jgi:rhodanese-related sulfurtransferase